jgi:hypothetical protein
MFLHGALQRTSGEVLATDAVVGRVPDDGAAEVDAVIEVLAARRSPAAPEAVLATFGLPAGAGCVERSRHRLTHLADRLAASA